MDLENKGISKAQSSDISRAAGLILWQQITLEKQSKKDALSHLDSLYKNDATHSFRDKDEHKIFNYYNTASNSIRKKQTLNSSR